MTSRPETRADTDRLIRRFIAGDTAAAAGIAARAESTSEPALLVAAALLDPAASGLLDRASAAARTTRDRQLVAIAAAHLDGDADRVDALAREHLADHPDHVLVAWIAATSRTDHEENR
jgi:hypothetical protein